MNHISILFLLALPLFSCNPKDNKVIIQKPDIEMAVINDILPHLIPKQSSCFPAPLEGESNEDYDKRLKDFGYKFETSTKKIEIINVLSKLENIFMKVIDLLKKKNVKTHQNLKKISIRATFFI